MRRSSLGLVALGVALIAAFAPGAARGENGDACEWLAGDLHVHTTYSHDAYGGPGDDNTGPEDFYTLGWTVTEEGAIARSRGLDYLAITDHNDIRSQSDPGWDFWNNSGLIMLPSYENSLAGHAQMHGATRLYDNGDLSLSTVQAQADELRAEGGVFQINHPADGEWVTAYGHSFVPDLVEIWNIGVWAYEPPAPATDNHETPLGFYDRFLDAGEHVGATGGSDSHWRSTTAGQGAGQPTTYVCSESRSVQGVLDGLAAGRSTIAHEPPAYGGPFAELRADGDANGSFESILGDTVTPGSAARAIVQGAPGATLRLVTNGSTTIAEVPVTSPSFTYDFTPPASSTWVRAEVYYEDGSELRRGLQSFCDQIADRFEEEVAYCESRLAVVAMTSPLYFESERFDPRTTLTYDGDSSGKVGGTATLAATLVGSDGPLAGVPVTFELRGETHTAVTDQSGRATTAVRLHGPPGRYEVISHFPGTDRYSPSQDRDPFEVTTGP